jgi:hypothetical protein
MWGLGPKPQDLSLFCHLKAQRRTKKGEQFALWSGPLVSARVGIPAWLYPLAKAMNNVTG